MATMRIQAAYGGLTLPEVTVPNETLVGQVVNLLWLLVAEQDGLDPAYGPPSDGLFKCMGPNGIRFDRLSPDLSLIDVLSTSSASKSNTKTKGTSADIPMDVDGTPEASIDIVGTIKVKVLLTTPEEVDSIRALHDKSSQARARAAQDRRRRRRERGTKSYKPPSSDYGFQALQTIPGLPDEKRALAILHVLANDPGIIGAMKERSYIVHSLEELLPDGRVGVDDVCVMGLNVNKGLKIKLRLRTDDLKGWRPLSGITKVLHHELAHNELADHTPEFFNLMATIRRTCDKHDYRKKGPRTNLGGKVVRKEWQTVVDGGDRPGLWVLDDDEDSEPEFSEARVLGKASIDVGKEKKSKTPVSPRQAAAEAALSRQQHEEEEHTRGDKMDVDVVVPSSSSSSSSSSRDKRHSKDRNKKLTVKDGRKQDVTKAGDVDMEVDSSDKRKSSKHRSKKSADKDEKETSPTSNISPGSSSSSSSSSSSKKSPEKEGSKTSPTSNTSDGSSSTKRSSSSSNKKDTVSQPAAAAIKSPPPPPKDLSGKELEIYNLVASLVRLPGGPQGCKLVMTIVKNALKHVNDTDSKYHRVNVSEGSAFHRRLYSAHGPAAFEGALAVLKASGFAEVASSDGKRTVCLTRRDAALLYMAKSWTEQMTLPAE